MHLPGSSLRSRLLRAGAIGVLLAAGFALDSAQAATPTEGTVSDTSTSVSWSGGPFVAPNVTAQANGTPDCTVPQSCDDYTLHVDTPAGYGTDHRMVVKVSWPNSAADFDVYALDANGDPAGTAASSADPETVYLPATSADYTVRVVPFAPLGQSYQATATLATTPTNPPPGTDTPPGFANYPAPGSFSGAHDAGEPSIGTNWNSDATMYQAGLSTAKVTFDDATSPTTATWTDVTASATNGCPQGDTTSLDPILYTDHTTGRTFESQLSGFDSLTCYTDDDGASWSPSQGGGIPSGVDHQTLGGGPFSQNGVGGIGVYPHAVYYCSQDIATAFCAISRDGGVTFGPGVPTYDLTECGGLHGHIKVGPDGTAYLPNKGCGATQAAVVSTDNGTSWTVEHVPGSTPGDSDPSIGIGSDGTVYFGYVGADGKPGVAVSHDHGKTWEHNQTVGTEFDINNAVFPAMVAGDGDRASFAYIGTPTDGNYQDSANFKGVWHLYVDTTYDSGKTWVTTDATPNDPVQRGSICTAGTTCSNDRNLLDFIDVTIDDHGRVEVAYADGCTGACVTDPTQNNHDAYATIARQSSGKPLFAQYDPVTTNLTLSSLDVSRARGRYTATTVIENSGDTAVSGVRTQISDNGSVVGLTPGVDLASGETATQQTTWRAKGRAHVVTAVVDPQNAITESDESDNKLQHTYGK
ncbi:MAG TPA: CARDB domain-containing protein [Nocardioidaceae bacterium]|nr:CARDB domain-containing protein [Nocardioidaceae bacterium]